MNENKIFESGNDDSVDFIAIIIELWNNRSFIFKACVLGAVLGILIAFSIPKTYEAKMTFAPETEQNIGSAVGSIASMMGVSLDNSVDAISVEMFPDVVATTPFIFDLLEMQVKTKDGAIDTTLAAYMLDHQKKPWWSHALGFPFKLLGMLTGGNKDGQDETIDMYDLSKEYRGIIKYFAKNIVVSQDNKTGKTQVSLTMQDPQVAATVLERVVYKLKAYMLDYRTSKDRQDVENLIVIYDQRKQDYYRAQEAYADFVDANKNLVLQRAQAQQLKLQQEMQLAYQVYSQVATQLEAARIKEQQAKPVFVVLEPVCLPLKKAPSKAKFMLAFAFFGIFISAFWVLLGKKYYSKIKSQYKNL